MIYRHMKKGMILFMKWGVKVFVCKDMKSVLSWQTNFQNYARAHMISAEGRMLNVEF